MNKQHQLTQARIKEITARLEDELGLSGYLQIHHHFVEGYDGDTEMTADERPTIYKTTAVTTTMWEYREAKITWYLGTACAASDERLEQVAVHEYVHALMGPLASLIPNKGNNAKLEELATESIARVIDQAPQAVTTLHEQMRLALLKATDSPDPSTQNGAILVAGDEALFMTAACNEFPAGVEYTDERWERPLKYEVIEHAERNSIFAAARLGVPTYGLTLVCPWAACTDCARAIIQAGLAELVTLAPEGEAHGHWGDSIDIAMVMLDEAGVKVTYLPGIDFADVPPLRRNGKPWSPC